MSLRPVTERDVAEPSLEQPVVVKKYANRRLYNTESSSYITLDNLAAMVRAGRDFVVYDAKSGDDITRGVLTQIIVEEEAKGSALLPTGFLRQLIGFYGDSMQGLLPRYLEQAMTSFARQQQQVRVAMQQTMGNFFPFGMEEMGRQNMALLERTMSLFTPPFLRNGEAPAGTEEPISDEIAALRAELASLRDQLAVALKATSGANGIAPSKSTENPAEFTKPESAGETVEDSEGR